MWLTTKELASLLGIAERGVLKRAKREGWESRPRCGRGGGSEWLVGSMPEATRREIASGMAARAAREYNIAPPRIPAKTFTVNTLSEVPEKRRRRATVRAMLARMVDDFYMASGTRLTTAYAVFSHEYNRGGIDAPEWARALVPHICRASLLNWSRTLVREGSAGLAGKYGKIRGTGVIDSTPGMVEVIIANIHEFYQIKACDVLDALMVSHAGQKLPSLRILQLWMSKYRRENPNSILKTGNPDAFRSRRQVAFGSRSAGITGINQLWEMDSSPADVLLADGKRYALIGCLDVGTRRAMLKVAKTSSAQGVCSLLRKSVMAWGVPETIKLDNGKDYTSFQVTSAIHDMGIRPDYCKPFTPEEKPHIERFFGTFQRRLKKLPGFIGHSVADRKAIESRKGFSERAARKSGERPALDLRYTPEEFQAFCDIWCRDVYGERKHGTLGVSPNEAAAKAAAGGVTLRVANERALDVLMRPAPDNGGLRTVRKDGIHVGNGKYIAAELGAIIGSEVQVRMEEEDAGRIYVFDTNGIFICQAVDAEMEGVSRREIAVAARAVQNAVENKKAREAKKTVARVKPQELVPLVVEMKRREAEANRAERALRYGAENSEEYTTPALAQAELAARANDAPGATLTPEEAAKCRAKAAEFLKKPWRIPVSDVQKFDEWLRIDALLREDEKAVSFEQANWANAWKNSNTFKYLLMMHEARQKLAGDVAKKREEMNRAKADEANIRPALEQ
ncbi:MAG: Mu transposase C-terminal domain-containing protein [Desulfovibrio sp.]|nr:Mu transposase C-terminal domain-containing protein [Desulfovibrio sp.]